MPWTKTTTLERLSELAAEVCRQLGRAGDTVEITLVDDAESRRINRDFLGRDRPTNVISFASSEPGELGQLVVNVDFARQQSGETGHGHSYLIGYYILHGLLHLAGYDHERAGDEQAAAMAAKEKALQGLLVPLTHDKEGQ